MKPHGLTTARMLRTFHPSHTLAFFLALLPSLCFSLSLSLSLSLSYLGAGACFCQLCVRASEMYAVKNNRGYCLCGCAIIACCFGCGLYHHHPLPLSGLDVARMPRFALVLLALVVWRTLATFLQIRLLQRPG